VKAIYEHENPKAISRSAFRKMAAEPTGEIEIAAVEGIQQLLGELGLNAESVEATDIVTDSSKKKSHVWTNVVLCSEAGEWQVIVSCVLDEDGWRAEWLSITNEAQKESHWVKYKGSAWRPKTGV